MPSFAILYGGGEHEITVLEAVNEGISGFRIADDEEVLEACAWFVRQFNRLHAFGNAIRSAQRTNVGFVHETLAQPAVESGELHDRLFQMPFCIILGPIMKIGRNVPMKTAAMSDTATIRTMKLMLAANAVMWF